MQPMTDAVRVAVQKIAHPDAEALELATIMRTVGDPVRLAIVRELADGDEQHGAAPDLIRHAAGEQERGEHPERVRRVNEREHRGREAPELAIGGVER